MAGMIQILTYLLSFYLVVKGIETLQIALASNRPERGGLIVFGSMTLVACPVGCFCLCGHAGPSSNCLEQFNASLISQGAISSYPSMTSSGLLSSRHRKRASRNWSSVVYSANATSHTNFG